MAAGVPVVASDIPGTRDLVVPGETGLLAPGGDRAGFTRHLLRLLDHPEVGQRLGAAGQRRAREAFSVERMVQSYAELYDQLLA